MATFEYYLSNQSNNQLINSLIEKIIGSLRFIKPLLTFCRNHFKFRQKPV
ncbi:DUF4441 domain-containing protein [Enterococcus hirae]|nr:DUF4441 domain-containing protein [Enterococcus hirae]